MSVLANEQSALTTALGDYAALRRWVELGRSRDMAWQGALTVAVGILMVLSLWFFCFKRFCCPCGCRRGEDLVRVPASALGAREADVDHIINVVRGRAPDQH